MLGLDLPSDQLVALDFTDWQLDMIHLGLSRDEYQAVPNMFGHLDIPDPMEELVHFCMENPAWAAKYILGVEILPFQGVMLEELWHKPFPMIIASRGAAKCVRGDTLIVLEDRIGEIQDLFKDAKPLEKISLRVGIFGENGFKLSDYGWCNGRTDTIKIVTRNGYFIEGTYNHPVRVVRNETVVWEDLSKIEKGDRVIIDRTDIWFPEKNSNSLDMLDGYCLGLLTGDGCLTQKNVTIFSTDDEELVIDLNKWSLREFDKEFVKTNSAKYDYRLYGKAIRKTLLDKFNLNYFKANVKTVPKILFSSKKEVVAAFLCGLFDIDGCVTDRGTVEFCTISEKMAKQVHDILLLFGIVSRLRDFKPKNGEVAYKIIIGGNNVGLFAEKIGFRLTRKHKKLDGLVNKKRNTNIDTIPIKKLLLSIRKKLKKHLSDSGNSIHHDARFFTNSRINNYGLTYGLAGKVLDICDWANFSSLEVDQLREFVNKNYFYDIVEHVKESSCITYDVHIPDGHSFWSNGFISHNSFILAVYAVLRALFFQGARVILVGGAFRQSKIIFEYIDTIWQKSLILQHSCGGERPKRQNDGCTLKIGESIIMSIPLGDGTKIRGLRAHYILVDEYDSVPYEVYQVVVRGFGSVKRDPVQAVKWTRLMDMLREQGIDTSRVDTTDKNWNQIVLSGTAGFHFKHFYQDYKRYEAIIKNKICQDNAQQFMEDLGEEFATDIENLDHRDFSIIKMPYTSLPDGYLDEKLIAQASATMPKMLFNMEYMAEFASDSDGFFRMSTLEYATCPFVNDAGEEVDFEPLVKGDPNKAYVMGVDPSHGQHDNFAIAIIELGPPNRIVNILTISVKGLKNLKKNDPTTKSIYDAGARAIQDLVKSFNIVQICMDAGGGGRSVLSLLQLDEFFRADDVPIWEVDDNDHKLHRGLHIMVLRNFQSSIWLSEANHTMLNDFEIRRLLFPRYRTNPVAGQGLGFNPLEDIYLEIQAAKTEISCITVSETRTAKEQFILLQIENDTPVNLKDRYTSVLLANDAAHYFQDIHGGDFEYVALGGTVDSIRRGDTESTDLSIYEGPNTGPTTVVDRKKGKGKIIF